MLTMKEDTMREMALLEDHDPGAVIITPEILGSVITQLMQPVMQTIGKMLENNTAALEQLSAAQSIQNDRLEALEKQIRLQTKVDGKQVSYLNDAIRRKSRAMLYEWEIDDGKAVRLDSFDYYPAAFENVMMVGSITKSTYVSSYGYTP